MSFVSVFPCLGTQSKPFFSVSYIGLFVTSTWRLGERRIRLGWEGSMISNPVTMDGAIYCLWVGEGRWRRKALSVGYHEAPWRLA